MTGARGAWWRVFRWPLAAAALAAVVVWNLVFDLWLGQGERQYLWEQARHALGEGPPVSLAGWAASAVRSGLVVATIWAVLVAAAVLAAAWLAHRATLREASRR